MVFAPYIKSEKHSEKHQSIMRRNKIKENVSLLLSDVVKSGTAPEFFFLRVGRTIPFFEWASPKIVLVNK